MSAPDFYQTLGVKRDASQDDIRVAYRARAKFYHPDKLEPNAPDVLRAECEARIKEINAAYETLSDPVKRAAYDAAPPVESVNLLDLANYATELSMTVAALKIPGEEPDAFARRLAFAAAKDTYRIAMTQDGRRRIGDFFTRIGRKAP